MDEYKGCIKRKKSIRLCDLLFIRDKRGNESRKIPSSHVLIFGRISMPLRYVEGTQSDFGFRSD